MANLRQERHIELVSGTQERFVITSRMTEAAVPIQLPHVNVFVVRVVDKSDAKDDAFARVARLSDLSLIPIGRDNALATTGEYLTTAVTLSYGTLTEAILAQTAVKDRVNKLIQDWMTFSTSFNAPDPTPVNFTLPTTDVPQKAALIQAYKAAKQDRYQKQLAKDATDALLMRAQAEFIHAQTLLSVAEALVTKAVALQATFAEAEVFYDALRSAGATFIVAAGCAAAGDRTAFQGVLNAAVNESTVLQGFVLDAGVLSATLAAFRTARAAERDAVSAAVSAATADQVAKTQALASAQGLEASALQAVLAICPDFDSTSVCLVSG